MTTIAMWSGPRNISTAMMYAFANRRDCTSWDEPFYGAYLKTTGLKHPMHHEIMAAMECDAAKVAALCTKGAGTPVSYQKHMTHHMLPQFDRGFIKKLSNAFLIRSPDKVLASYAKKHEEVSLHAIGFVEQAELFDMVCAHLGHAPPVVDADAHLENPAASLQRLCKQLGISFDEAMLSWTAGPKACDGVWAPHWYNAAWDSQGFQKQNQDTRFNLSRQLSKIADDAWPYYEKLRAHAFPA